MTPNFNLMRVLTFQRDCSIQDNKVLLLLRKLYLSFRICIVHCEKKIMGRMLIYNVFPQSQNFAGKFGQFNVWSFFENRIFGFCFWFCRNKNTMQKKWRIFAKWHLQSYLAQIESKNTHTHTPPPQEIKLRTHLFLHHNTQTDIYAYTQLRHTHKKPAEGSAEVRMEAIYRCAIF